MSAEKDIVNFWYNQKGFFTINNIKAGNRDGGIIAVEPSSKEGFNVFHVEISCSISGSSALKNSDAFVRKILSEKFRDKSILKEVGKHVKNFSALKDIKRVLVLGNIPKSRKESIVSKFKEKGIIVLELGIIIDEVLGNIDTQYYRNGVIRTMQLIKFFSLSNPKILANLSSNISSVEKNEFLNTILERENIVKQFRKTDEDKFVSILSHASVTDAKKLANLIHKKVLNRNTRKIFFENLLKLQGIKEKTRKNIVEKSLDNYF